MADQNVRLLIIITDAESYRIMVMERGLVYGFEGSNARTEFVLSRTEGEKRKLSALIVQTVESLPLLNDAIKQRDCVTLESV